jgi:hypothetical protein
MVCTQVDGVKIGGLVAGKIRSAKRLSRHLGEPVDAACAVSRPGSIEARRKSARSPNPTGFVAATAIGMAADRAGVDGEVNAGVISWLALGPDGFSLTKGGSQLGRPKGEPIARFGYTQVDRVELTPGERTTRADISLKDGATVSFETSSPGGNMVNVEVLELLRERCVPG